MNLTTLICGRLSLLFLRYAVTLYEIFADSGPMYMYNYGSSASLLAKTLGNSGVKRNQISSSGYHHFRREDF